MLLRRIISNVGKQNWPAVGLELMIVVIGVFLGLQAQEWSKRRTDQRKERAYLGRLAVDFESIETHLENCLDVYRDSIAAIDAVTKALSTPNQAPDGFDITVIRMTAGDLPAGRSATFVELISTGDLSLLRDQGLRKALIAYDEQAQVNREIWRSLRDAQSLNSQSLYSKVVLKVRVGKGQLSSIQSFDLKAMSLDPAFRAMLNAFAASKGNIYELCRHQLVLAGHVRRTLSRPP